MSDFYNPILDPARNLTPDAVSRALDQYTYELEDSKRRREHLIAKKQHYISVLDKEIANCNELCSKKHENYVFFGPKNAKKRQSDTFYELKQVDERLKKLKAKREHYISLFEDEIKSEETRMQEAMLVLDMLQNEYDVDFTEVIIDVPDGKNGYPTKEKEKYEIVPVGEVEELSDDEFLALYGSPIF